MHRQTQKLRKIIALTTLCLAFVPFCLAQQKTLQNDSPFLPPGYSKNQAPPPPPNNQPPGQLARTLQLRGVMRMHGTYSLSFFDKKTNKSFWIQASAGNADGYRVGRYDPNTMSIEVTVGRSTERVTLISSSNKPQTVNASINVAKTTPAFTPQAAKPPANDAKKTARSIPRRRVILPNKK